MKKIVIFLGIFMLCVPSAAQYLPITEKVTIADPGFQYSNDFAFSVYTEKGLTFEIEEWMVHVEIEPQIWEEGISPSLKDPLVFSKILILIVISDSKGSIRADFLSYLNCTFEDCSDIESEVVLFWDHAGEERADNAGQIFGEDAPLVISDECCEVTLSLVKYLHNDWLYPCGETTPTGQRLSDAQCIALIKNMVLEVSIDYSTTHETIFQSLKNASECVKTGDYYLERGEQEKALREFKRARESYDRIGDIVRLNEVQERIDAIDLLRLEEYLASGDELIQAGNDYLQAGDIELARSEYKKAKEIYDTAGDKEKSESAQALIDTCSTYETAREYLEKGRQLYVGTVDVTDHEDAIRRYEEARSYFEKAKTEFEQLRDLEQSEKCTYWIILCNDHLNTFQKNGEKSYTFAFIILAIVTAGLVILVLLLRRQT